VDRSCGFIRLNIVYVNSYMLYSNNLLTSNSFYSLYPDLFTGLYEHSVFPNTPFLKSECYDTLRNIDSSITHMEDICLENGPLEIHTSIVVKNLNYSSCFMNQERHNLTNHGNNQMNYNFSSFANLSCHESLSFGVAYCFPITSLDFSHDISKSYLSVALDAHIFISYNTSSNSITHMKSLILHSFSTQNYFPSIDLILHTQNLHPKFHDRVADWLERSYFERFPRNGKASVIGLSNADQWGKAYLFLFIYHYKSFQSRLLIYSVYFLPGLNMLWWLHWFYHITWALFSLVRCRID